MSRSESFTLTFETLGGEIFFPLGEPLLREQAHCSRAHLHMFADHSLQQRAGGLQSVSYQKRCCAVVVIGSFRCTWGDAMDIRMCAVYGASWLSFCARCAEMLVVFVCFALSCLPACLLYNAPHAGMLACTRAFVCLCMHTCTRTHTHTHTHKHACLAIRRSCYICAVGRGRLSYVPVTIQHSSNASVHVSPDAQSTSYIVLVSLTRTTTTFETQFESMGQWCCCSSCARAAFCLEVPAPPQRSTYVRLQGNLSAVQASFRRRK